MIKANFQPNRTSLEITWAHAWSQRKFRWIIVVVSAAFPILLIGFSSFLNYIEKRDGIVLNDAFLDILPSIDLSVPIFTLLWMMIVLLVWQAISSPRLFLMYLMSFMIICLSRIVTIASVPLNAPIDMVPLVDPLVNQAFYGGTVITKDLFYSGHTATVFLAFLCFNKKVLKIMALLATWLIAVMLLIQHAHYTIDVVAAPIFTYMIYKMVSRLIKLMPVFVIQQH